MKDTYIAHTQQEQNKPKLLSLSEFLDYSLPFEQLRETLELTATPLEFQNEIDRVAAIWACISSKTDRERWGREVPYCVDVHHNLIKCYPVYERMKSKAPDRTEKRVNKFSKKSKNRLMQKSKMIDYDIYNLPFFVTLTYQSEMRDCGKAKKDMRTLFKRLRRLNNSLYNRKQADTEKLNYIWKMEFQKRGAIHFHIALFLPKRLEKRLTYYQKASRKDQMVLLQCYISSVWNEITGENTNNLLYGTQVEYVQNVRMAIGYMNGYLCKNEQTENEYIENTGRFWGFSYGFDFSAVYSKATGFDDIQNLFPLLSKINESALNDTYMYLKSEYEKAKKIKNDQKREIKKKKIANQLKRQIMRYKKNKIKIKKGAYFQFQLNKQKSISILKEVSLLTKKAYFNARNDVANVTNVL